MKVRSLTTAIAGCLITGLGLAPGAQAMNLNPLGTGQVLIYPYYTVNAGNQTLITVVNKTDAGKAVKVRFRESRNARAALDFHVYLSPFDVWTAALFSLSDTGPNNPANLITTDNSCTVPRIKGNTTLPALANGNRYVPFLNYSYTGSNDDAGPETLDRTREGYFEMIEMGEVVNRENASLADITHSGGVPNNCARVIRAWLPAGTNPEGVAYWSFNAQRDIDPPQGGLFGTASIVDALAGTMMAYNAEAIDDFSDIAQHTAPAAPAPTLASGRTTADTAVAIVFDEGVAVTSTFPQSRAIDAVSALFMQDELLNEFATSSSIGGASEWVVTMPTKYAYTDQAIVGTAAIAPFARIFPTAASEQNNGIAAVDFRRYFFSREGNTIGSMCDPQGEAGCMGGISIPPQLGTSARLQQWFWASNVVSFGQFQSETTSRILGSPLTVRHQPEDVGIRDGWYLNTLYSTHIDSNVDAIHLQRLRPDLAGGIWDGLPIAGFWVVSYTNGQLVPGVLSNYAAAYRHGGGNHYVTP
jgi:hypothetical protein